MAHPALRLLTIAGLIWAVTANAQDRDEADRKIRDAGFGFSFSSGQSLFYSIATNPFRTNHTYLSLGFHLEEQGISVPFYDPILGSTQRNSTSDYYLELSLGWRRLWFRESMAGGFFPHTVLEVGTSGYLAQQGSLGKFFRETSFRWTPLLQAGLGGSVYTGVAIYRIELGLQTALNLNYFQSLLDLSYFSDNFFPAYEGMYIKMIFSSGEKPR